MEEKIFPVFPVESDSQVTRDVRPPERGIWRVDSDIELALDRLPERRPSPELDLGIPPRSRLQQTQTNTANKMPSRSDRRENEPKGREASGRRHESPKAGPSQWSKEQASSRDRRRGRSANRSRKPRDTSRSLHRDSNRHGNNWKRTRGNGSPPSSDDNYSDRDRDSDHRRKKNRRSRHPGRRGNPSPDDDDNESDDGDSSDGDNLAEASATRSGRFRIKLQKFDATGSWEYWWAHFENCASYNRWTERDRLAFMKGALTGNAAQVLWDTDRASTGSLKKLISILKGRFSGERQAEKYRAELQIRRRMSSESLTELHQDIRRLMALAYPRLTAEAREEIACDHFTIAFSDPDFALKVKEIIIIITPTISNAP